MNMTVHIEKIVTGGYGLGRRQDGMVVLSRHVLPGETVLLRETGRHRGHLEGEPVEILNPSPDRVEPLCPYYSRCGGCDFQHIAPSAQLRIKEEILGEALLRAGIPLSPSLLRPILPSPDVWHYRHRLRLKLSRGGSIGFFRPASNDLVDVDQCPVATTAINTVLRELRRCPQLPAAAAAAREIELQDSPADHRVFLRLHPRQGRIIAPSLAAGLAESLPAVSDIVVRGTESRQQDLLRQDFDTEPPGRPFSLTWTPDCFSQVNAGQNRRLIDLLLSLTGPVAGKRILDLYCGMGNFSVPLAVGGALVFGVERSRESIARARINAAAAWTTDTLFIDGDVPAAVKRFIQQSATFDIIVLDPPRAGLGRDSVQLADLKPEKIIYVSCDPATLARDIVLLSARNFALTGLTPVDMFPQTHHIESVALLEKN